MRTTDQWEQNIPKVIRYRKQGRGMSKYYKAEDVISFLNTHCPKDMWEYQIAKLPTIEVSEDCISREDLLKHAYKREGVMSVSVDSIKLAPSVAPTQTNAIQHTQSVESVESVEPTTEQSCDTCKYRELYECSDCRFASKWERIEE